MTFIFKTPTANIYIDFNDFLDYEAYQEDPNLNYKIYVICI